jgi:hypothetical protein
MRIPFTGASSSTGRDPVQTRRYVRSNIQVSLLAKAYAASTRGLSGGPGAFAERVRREAALLTRSRSECLATQNTTLCARPCHILEPTR